MDHERRPHEAGVIPINSGERNAWGPAPSPYEELGGDTPLRQLVEAFYDIIEDESPTLRAMLPANTSTSRQKLHEFLSGWLGGPPLYEEKRGHPRLRMRHLPFPIGETEAAEWMRCFLKAMDLEEVPTPLRQFLNSRLEPLARHMINQ
jgi:hemoglobin